MSQTQWKEPSEDEAQMPLGTGTESEAFTDSAPSIKKPKINGPTAILIGAFVSAIAVIYLLGMQNKPQTASAEQTEREDHANSAITELLEKKGKAEQLQGLFTDTKKLVGIFYSYLGSQKTEIPRLSHDPFGDDEPPAVTPNKEAVVIVNNNPQDAEKLRQIADTLNTLKLNSIMMGNISVAMINNKMFQVGNKIGDLTVSAIEPNRVLLTYKKNTFELKLPAPNTENQ